MIHSDEDDEFERIEHENKLRQGQPYHYDTYVSPSQRNQVLEEAAKVCENSVEYAGDELAKQIRAMKT